MSGRPENIRIVNCDFIILALVVFFVLLAGNEPSLTTPGDSTRKPVTTYLTVSEIYAVSNPEIHLPLVQKTWTSVKDNYYPADSNRNPVAENKITDIKIFIFQVKRYNISDSSLLISRIQLFTSEKDDPFHLS
jgi:hypothetical protein